MKRKIWDKTQVFQDPSRTYPRIRSGCTRAQVHTRHDAVGQMGMVWLLTGP